MSKGVQGILFITSCVILEAVQAVFLGAVFQDIDSFLIGGLVFGTVFVVTMGSTALFRPVQLRAARLALQTVVMLNLAVALTWSSYFFAVQMIEPAVVFTIFSGMIPLVTRLAGRFGFLEAGTVMTGIAKIGNAMIALSILALCITTLTGHSGFVRGDWTVGLAGICLALCSGGMAAFIILYSVRLNGQGVGPFAQFGLRFFLYVILASFFVYFGFDAKEVVLSVKEIFIIYVIGLGVIGLPLYLFQKSIPLTSATTIAAVTALGPAIVFALQLMDARLSYAPATLAGLILYIAGSFIAAYGVARSRPAPGHS
jgi:drug/metabolite transporter (DMT)-like permease